MRNNVIMAFTVDQIARLSGITRARLSYWERTGAFVPERIGQLLPGPYARVYTFQDLVSLRVMADLRINHGVELQQLRNVSQYIAEYSEYPWSRLAIHLFGDQLVFKDPHTGQWMSAEALGQLTYIVDLEMVSQQAEADARASLRRASEDQGQVSRHRAVMNNQWVFKGTRIPVEVIQDYIQLGYSVAAILAEFPTLSESDIARAKTFEHNQAHVA